MPNKPVHILRYGTVAEKAHLEKAISAYDYLSINGNTAAYVSTAIAKFIVDKFFSKPEKGFFIDPITYAFQQEIRLLKSKSKTTGEIKIKKSVDKLIDYYLYPTDNVRMDKPIAPSDFVDNRKMEAFCDRVLSFQYNIVHEHIEKNDLGKYLDYVAPDWAKSVPQLRPKFLIAPYFYLDSNDLSFQEWLRINVKFVDMAAEKAKIQFEGIDVFAQIVLDKNLLMDDSKIQAIIGEYEKANCHGYTIWIDDLNEHEASKEELCKFTNLLRSLHKKPIYNMYGGYFSIMLTNKKVALLDGVSHGLEYGESRKVYPVGGGLPVSKYYYLPIHKRLDFTDAFYLLKHANIVDTDLADWGNPEKYYKEICKCSQCRKVIKNKMINFVAFESNEFYEVHIRNRIQRRKKASPETKKNCLYHYLLCKKVEFSQTRNKAVSELISNLISQKAIYSHCDALKDNELDYLDIWASVLED